MNHIKILLSAGAALCVLAAPAQAAVLVNAANVGQSFQIAYAGQVNGGATDQIGAVQTFTFAGLANGGLSYRFSVDTTNSSAVDSLLRSFGFDVTSATVTGGSATGTYSHIGFGDTFPEGVGAVEVCFQATSNGNCTGGPGGLAAGQSGNTVVTLTFGSALSSITLDNFVTRFQSIRPVINGGDSGIGVPMSAVPEPASWGLMLAGLGAIGCAMRRRRADRAFA